MSLPYVYTPRPGERITVSRDKRDGCGLAVCAGGAAAVRIPAENAQDVAAHLALAICEAAGLPGPVILERPGVTFEGGVNRAGPIEVGRLNGSVTVGLYGVLPEEIKPAEARRLAALIAVRADEVQDGEPDPAEVEELAALLHATRERGSRGSAGIVPGEWDRRDARAILRAGWKREEPE